MQELQADSPTLAAARARLLQAQGQARQAGAVQGPEIGANLGVNEQKLSYHNGNDFVPRDWNTYGSATLNFSYEFDFWGKTALRSRQRSRVWRPVRLNRPMPGA